MSSSPRSPIIISGFGRSGTTWISDILSKSLGGLILFEPFHPCVFQKAEKYCYHTQLENINEVYNFIDQCFEFTPNNPWLLRNHLPYPIENSSESYLEYIWINSKKIGFKTIRMNHAVGQLAKHFNAKVIYIYRHPFSVIVSIKKRKNFWNEFNWSWHYSTFLKRTVIEKNFGFEVINRIKKVIEKVSSLEEQIFLMWYISLSLSLNDLKNCQSLVVRYEDIYLNPYSELFRILTFLNEDKATVHPSYFFTPSMTSLTTLHPTYNLNNLDEGKLDEVFWKNKLNNTKTKLLNTLKKELGTIFPNVEKVIKRKYSFS